MKAVLEQVESMERHMKRDLEVSEKKAKALYSTASENYIYGFDSGYIHALQWFKRITNELNKK